MEYPDFRVADKLTFFIINDSIAAVDRKISA